MVWRDDILDELFFVEIHGAVHGGKFVGKVFSLFFSVFLGFDLIFNFIDDLMFFLFFGWRGLFLWRFLKFGWGLFGGFRGFGAFVDERDFLYVSIF